MGRVPTLLDVKTFMKIFATIAVALLAFVAMANPAWAQDTTLEIDLVETIPDPPTADGNPFTYLFEVTNVGAYDASGVTFDFDILPPDYTDYDNAWIDFGSASASPSQGSCTKGPWNENDPDVVQFNCDLGNLAPGAKATIAIKLTPTDAGKVSYLTKAAASNATAVLFPLDARETTVEPYEAKLSVDTRADPDPAVAGEALTYTIWVTNSGYKEADNVSLTVALDFGDTNVDPGSVSASTASDVQGSCAVKDPGEVVCSLGDLAPRGEEAAVTIRLTPTSAGTISSTATAQAPDVPPATDTTTTTVDPQINELSVDTQADPDPAFAGKVLTYTVVVTNTGNIEAEDVTFLDSMDFGDTNVDPGSVSASTTQPGGSCTTYVGDPTTVVCLLANLAPGAKATVTIKLTPTSVGTISNTATARGLYAPRVTDTTTTTVGPSIAKLSVDTRADSDLARAGKALTYTVVVTNTGALEAEGVTLLDVLDFGTVEVDPASFSVYPGLSPTPEGSCLRLGGTATSATVSCTLPNLAPGASATVTIKLTPTTQGTISNSAVAAASNTQSAEKSITTAVVPDLVISKSGPSRATMSDLFYNDLFTYEITVHNQGPTTANNVIVTDALPAGPQGQSVATAGYHGDSFLTCGESPPGVVRCEGTLPAGETSLIRITAYAGPAGSPAWVINNTAEVSVQGISSVIGSSTATTQAVPVGSGLPGEEPGEDNGKRVLIDHKGKELCLPKAALKGHLRHGDEVISEEGCSNNPGEETGEDNGERVLVEHKGKELCLPKAALNGHLNHGDEVIDEEGCSNAEDGGRKGLK